VSIIGFGRGLRDIQDPLITEVIAYMQKAAKMAVVAKKFSWPMETFQCNYQCHTFRLVLTMTGLAKFPSWIAPWKCDVGRCVKPQHGRDDIFYA
jgi:hypothetical protein